MSKYSVVPNEHGHGYCVQISAGNGVRHTMLGFGTEDDARSWIEADKGRERFMQGGILLSNSD